MVSEYRPSLCSPARLPSPPHIRLNRIENMRLLEHLNQFVRYRIRNCTSIRSDGMSVRGNGTSIISDGMSVMSNGTSIISDGTSVIE